MKKIFLIGMLFASLWSYAQSNIVAAEYFFDSDPGVGAATALPAFTASPNLDVTFLAASSGLSQGMHILGMRVRDNNNLWSIPMFLPVYILVNNPDISGAEYFFDADPGSGNATAITVTTGATIDLTFAANSSALAVGMHIMGVRTRNPTGEWSIPSYIPFYIDLSRTITKLEYFFDTDPGSGNGTTITVSPTTDLLDQVYSMNSSALALGTHSVNVRVAGQNNFWSIPETKSFNIATAIPPTITSFTPASGPIGTAITIIGTDFSTTPSNNIVYFGATKATVTAATPTQLTVTVPTGATYQPITVQVAGLTGFSSKPFIVTFAGGGSIDACSFAPAVTIGAVPGFTRPAFADIDGDGKPDLLIPESTNNQLSIFRNISTAGTITPGSFEPRVSFATVNTPFSVAVGDLDSDGKRDIAVINYTSGKLSVYKNLSTPGVISLDSKVDFNIPSFAHDVSIADIDGDGKQDLTITTSLVGLTVLRNTGIAGVIDASTFAAGIDFATGPNPNPFVLGDIDGDGKLDAAVPNANAYSVSLLRNTSTSGVISFAAQVVLTTAAGSPAPGAGTVYTALGDIDGDNSLDLVVTNNTVNTYSIYRNISTAGTFSFDPKYDLPTIANANTPSLGDLDGDGKIDLITDYSNTSIAIYKNISTTGMINATSLSSPVTFARSISSGLLNGDVDGDGRNDVITTSASIQVFRNMIGLISPPTITFFPPSGSIGSSITITGTNFGTPFNNTVRINGLAATITSSTATTLTVTIPVGATTGPFEVTIGCNTVTSSSNFTVATSQNFIAQWNLATAGSGPTQLSFGTATSGIVNYTWQEISPGSATGSGSWSGSTLTITGLPTGATIRLEIEPTNFQRININNGLDRNRLTQVEQWGTTAWTSMERAFFGCAILQITATDVPDLANVSNMESMFSGCTSLNSPSNINTWNTATITNMSGLFEQAIAFNQNIGSWNTGAVTQMIYMVKGASAFNQNIGSWNTGAVTNMIEMFRGAIAFNQNIGSWNTGAVVNMRSMFAQATSFNQNIGSWNISAVVDTRGMFWQASAFNQNISSWNTAAVTDMFFMFWGASSFNQDISSWNTAAVTIMGGMFEQATAFNQNLGTWTLNATVNLSNMLNNSGMNCNNYSSTLIGWSANPSTPNGRTLGATGRQYGTNAVAARTNLTITKGWTITADSPSGAVCAPSVPTITSFTPTSGPVGITVTITGTNFSTTRTNNTVQFNGTTAVVTTSTATSIATTVPVGTTTGTITVTVAGNTATSATNFTVTASPVITITAQPSDFIACVGQTATFTTAAAGATNIIYQWQFSPNGIVPYIDIANGGGYANATTATLSVNTTANFGLGRYRCRINGDFASEVITTDQGLSINPISTAPTVVGANRCGAGSVTLTASGGSNGQYKWYTTATGGTAIAGETNGNYVTPSITSTTSYYVSLNTNGCESTRTLVIATITITPAPTATGVSGCPASLVTLTASGGINGQYNWYTVATGGTAIAGEVNSTYQILSLAASSTFYVSVTNSGCESTRTPVIATLLSTGCAPVITAQTLATQVEGKIEINLQSLITTPGTLDPTSIKVITQPASGAVASITNFLLVIDYKGKPFSGKETIIIEACNTNGLCSQQTFTIEVAGEVIVFNAVSPNGDGKNEFLVLQYIESISPKNQVSIYNRWGDEVFSISDYDNKTRVFAGLSNSGSQLPSGTYFYKIALQSTGEVSTGFLSLKR